MMLMLHSMTNKPS